MVIGLACWAGFRLSVVAAAVAYSSLAAGEPSASVQVCPACRRVFANVAMFANIAMCAGH